MTWHRVLLYEATGHLKLWLPLSFINW